MQLYEWQRLYHMKPVNFTSQLKGISVKYILLFVPEDSFYHM